MKKNIIHEQLTSCYDKNPCGRDYTVNDNCKKRLNQAEQTIKELNDRLEKLEK
jgi:hypothetical protein